MAEYNRQNMVYEKEHLLISGPGKYPEYNFWAMAGKAVSGRTKGEGVNQKEPVDVKSILPWEKLIVKRDGRWLTYKEDSELQSVANRLSEQSIITERWF